MFKEMSTSVTTVKTRRMLRIMQRSKVSDLITSAGVYNCRKIANSDSWSQHSWGHAIDFMCAGQNVEKIARNIILQGTKRTIANRGKRVPIERVIWGTRMWRYGIGEVPYGGVPHVTHVHVDFRPNKTGTPPCAG